MLGKIDIDSEHLQEGTWQLLLLKMLSHVCLLKITKAMMKDNSQTYDLMS